MLVKIYHCFPGAKHKFYIILINVQKCKETWFHTHTQHKIRKLYAQVEAVSLRKTLELLQIYFKMCLHEILKTNPLFTTTTTTTTLNACQRYLHENLMMILGCSFCVYESIRDQQWHTFPWHLIPSYFMNDMNRRKNIICCGMKAKLA